MRIAVAQIAQESGSFLPEATDIGHFVRGSLTFGADFLSRTRRDRSEPGGSYEVLTEEAVEIVPIIGATALPWGPLTAPLAQYFVATIREGLREAGPLDGVLLHLHGALCADGEPDVDGLIIEAARHAVGSHVPIVVTVDPHALLTDRMVVNSEAVVAYRTYPHVDYYETGRRGAALLIDAIRERTRPVARWRHIPIITPAESQDTTRGPMAEMMRLLDEIEDRPGVLSASLAFVQPWLDVPEHGWGATAVTDGDPRMAQELADEIAAECWRRRADFDVQKVPADIVVRRARSAVGTVVVSDAGDNTGGGGAGDSTVLLAALLRSDDPPRSVVYVTDPDGAAMAALAGIGAKLHLSVGASVDTINSVPVDIEGFVIGVPSGRIDVAGDSLAGVKMDLGTVAVLQCGALTVILTSNAFYNIEPDLMRQLGVEPLDFQLVHTKSPCGFRAAYEPIASEVILMESPGVTTSAFEDLPWRNIQRPLYPLDPEMSWDPARKDDLEAVE